MQKLWFILTNASLWSIGMAENAGDKIKVTECYQHFILYKKGSDLDEQDTKTLVTLLYKLKQILNQAVRILNVEIMICFNISLHHPPSNIAVI